MRMQMQRDARAACASEPATAKSEAEAFRRIEDWADELTGRLRGEQDENKPSL
jgi:hypothetical protein